MNAFNNFTKCNKKKNFLILVFISMMDRLLPGSLSNPSGYNRQKLNDIFHHSATNHQLGYLLYLNAIRILCCCVQCPLKISRKLVMNMFIHVNYNQTGRFTRIRGIISQYRFVVAICDGALMSARLALA